jgi:peptide-methionine (S)-S-oxide reductase
MNNFQTATFAGGCFWCTEAIFKRLKGVTTVTSGYTGGTTDNPTYNQLHETETGHAEAIEVNFDPSIISYSTLLDVFFGTHDPTTLNRQGNDQGTEYRSVIFYHDEEQKNLAFTKKKQLEDEKKFSDPIVTEIIPYTKFYPAEEDHKDYYDRNQNAPYCKIIIDPKIQKLMKNFSESVKEEYKQ